MTDRQPLHPGRVKLVPVAGQENVYDMVRADEALVPGTELKKATLLSDETERFIWGDAKDRTVDEALYTAKKNTNHVFEVGDIRVTARTDLGDDWLLCNGEVITDDYPVLKEQIYPVRYAEDSDAVEDKRFDAYYNGKYYSLQSVIETRDSVRVVVVGLYSKVKIYEAWQLELEHIYESEKSGAGWYTGYDTRNVVLADGILNYIWYLDQKWVNGKFNLDDMAQSEVGVIGTSRKAVGWACDAATGRWYRPKSNTTDKVFGIGVADSFYVSDSTISESYTLEDTSFNSDYDYGASSMRCDDGIVYGSFYNRHGSYLFAFTDPNNIALVTFFGTSSTARRAKAYYSDMLGTVVGWASNDGLYTYDRASNTWTKQENAPYMMTGDTEATFTDIVEFEGRFIACNGKLMDIYTNILDSSTLVASGTYNSNGALSSSPYKDYGLSNGLRASPHLVLHSGGTTGTSGTCHFSSHLRTITIDNAYVYIRGRVTE